MRTLRDRDKFKIRKLEVEPEIETEVHFKNRPGHHTKFCGATMVRENDWELFSFDNRSECLRSRTLIQV